MSQTAAGPGARLLPVSYCFGSREFESDDRAPVGSVGGAHGSSMLLCDLAHDGQTRPEPGIVRAVAAR